MLSSRTQRVAKDKTKKRWSEEGSQANVAQRVRVRPLSVGAHGRARSQIGMLRHRRLSPRLLWFSSLHSAWTIVNSTLLFPLPLCSPYARVHKHIQRSPRYLLTKSPNSPYTGPTGQAIRAHRCRGGPEGGVACLERAQGQRILDENYFCSPATYFSTSASSTKSLH